ncbi:MAG: hypothetical protein A3K83_01510 [Omnitrophica WOR_2 bacterium RBG_13_44_8b]|nr:MAG: hypothetical protein A3K83_01510 [Omnitrophica WOR_2 bacterium RBG_13_44_8b]
MNILYLANHLNTGGITSYVYALASGMRQSGHRVYLASAGGEHLGKFQQQGIIFIPVPMKTKAEISPKIMISMLKLSKIISKNDIELVHSNSRTTQVLGCLLSRLKGVRHVWTCHGFFKNRILRKIFPCWGQAVIAISEPVKEHLVRDFKLDGKKIFTIPNGIDAHNQLAPGSKPQIEIKKELGLHDGPVVGIVARLSDVKGHAYLIQAMSNVLKKFPRAQLVIVGEGRMKKELEELSRDLGVEKCIHFIPKVCDTREVLSVMDVFVMPSLAEGLGLALMEAMASGLACIGSDVGGIKSLIQHRFNGLLVSPKDHKQLQDAIEELLGDAEKREFYGSNAKNYIIQNFNQEKMIRQTEEVYARC